MRCNTNLVTMELKSERFIVFYCYVPLKYLIKEKKFLDPIETENGIKKILNYNIFDDNTKKILTKNIAKK